jgi:hypothetical protein
MNNIHNLYLYKVILNEGCYLMDFVQDRSQVLDRNCGTAEYTTFYLQYYPKIYLVIIQAQRDGEGLSADAFHCFYIYYFHLPDSISFRFSMR